MLAVIERPRPHHPAAEAPAVRSQSLSRLGTSSRRTSISGSSLPNFDRLMHSFEKRLLSSKRFSYVSTLWRRGLHKDASRSNNLDKLLFEFFRAHNRDDDLLTNILRREWKEIGGDSLEDFLRRSQTTALSERLLDLYFQTPECKSYAEKLLSPHVDRIFHVVQDAERDRASASVLVCRMADICVDILQSFCKAPLKDIPLDIRKVGVAVADVCADRPTAVGAVSCALFGVFIGDALFDVAQAKVDDDYTQDDCDVVEGQLYVCEMIMKSVASLHVDPELEKLIDQKAQDYLVHTIVDKLGREVLGFVYRLADKAGYLVDLVDSIHIQSPRDSLTSRQGGEKEMRPDFMQRYEALKQLALFCYSHGILESSSSRLHDSDCVSNPGSDAGSDSPVAISPPRRPPSPTVLDEPSPPKTPTSPKDTESTAGGEDPEHASPKPIRLFSVPE